MTKSTFIVGILLSCLLGLRLQSLGASPAAQDQAALNEIGGLLNQALAAENTDEARRLLDVIIRKSDALKASQSADPSLWATRAVAALILDQEKVGRESAQHLEELGAGKSGNTVIVQIMAKLRDKGWTALPATTSIPAAPAGLTLFQRRLLESTLEDALNADPGSTFQTKRLQQVLVQTTKLVEQHPDNIWVWSVRAMAAMEMDRAKEGWEAGKKMKQLDAENSTDEFTMNVLISLTKRGWMGGAGPPKRETKSQTGEVRAIIIDPDGYTNVRASGNDKSRIIGRVNENQQFLVMPDNGTWWRVRLPDGTKGFMRSNRIKLLAE